MAFPLSLLTHSVRVYRRYQAKAADQSTVEQAVLLGTADCLISGVQAAVGPDDHQEAAVVSATLTGVDPVLGRADVKFVVVTGPRDLPAGTALFPAGRGSPHGSAAGIDDFFRHQVSTVLYG